MRIDPAHHVAGLRINAWVSLGICIVGVAWFVYLGRRPAPADGGGGEGGAPVALDDAPPAEPQGVATSE
jgi:hypothetical protein